MIADDLVYHLVSGITICQGYGSAENHFFTGKLGDVDNLRARDLIFSLADLEIEQRLSFLGGMKFGVFRQITVAARFFDVADVARTLNGLEALQFRQQKLVAFIGHRHACVSHFPQLLDKIKTPRNRSREALKSMAISRCEPTY